MEFVQIVFIRCALAFIVDSPQSALDVHDVDVQFWKSFPLSLSFCSIVQIFALRLRYDFAYARLMVIFQSLSTVFLSQEPPVVVIQGFNHTRSHQTNLPKNHPPLPTYPTDTCQSFILHSGISPSTAMRSAAGSRASGPVHQMKCLSFSRLCGNFKCPQKFQLALYLWNIVLAVTGSS